MSLAEIQSAVQRLAESEKEELAVWLLGTLPPGSHVQSSIDDLAEARARRDQLISGVVKGIPADEFWKSLDEPNLTPQTAP
jgi:hypothetical protein